MAASALLAGGGGLSALGGAGMAGATSAPLSGIGAAAAGAGIMAGGGILSGLISHGLNAQAASKAHDRSKNMITRKWLYEQIALKEAGINPGYIFANAKGAAQGGSQRAQMASPAQMGKGGDPNFLLQSRLINANTQAQKANAAQALTGSELNLASAERQRAAATLDLARAENTKSQGVELTAMAKFWASPEGQEVLRQLIKQKQVPDNWVSALGRAFTYFLTPKRREAMAQLYRRWSDARGQMSAKGAQTQSIIEFLDPERYYNE